MNESLYGQRQSSIRYIVMNNVTAKVPGSFPLIIRWCVTTEAEDRKRNKLVMGTIFL